MPTIYLSPSTQEFNPYNGGGNEEFYMNLVADAMEPYLAATGIQFTRNTPEMTAASSIAASNSGNYDLHLALHSNAVGSGQPNTRGIDVYYYPTSERGKRFADIAVNNLQTIYPLPGLVKAVPTTTLGEVGKVRAPGILIELGYHDNFDDANWIRNNINNIAETLVISLAEYFGIPFNMPQPITVASVATMGSNLNLRAGPSINSAIVGSIPNGSEILIFARLPEWDLISYNGLTGYVNNRYILAPIKPPI